MTQNEFQVSDHDSSYRLQFFGSLKKQEREERYL